MKIKSHSESHIVELDDRSRWQIFPGAVILDAIEVIVLVGGRAAGPLRVARLLGPARGKHRTKHDDKGYLQPACGWPPSK